MKPAGVPLAANREIIEAQLIEAYQPMLNVQLKKTGHFDCYTRGESETGLPGFLLRFRSIMPVCFSFWANRSTPRSKIKLIHNRGPVLSILRSRPTAEDGRSNTAEGGWRGGRGF
jgi:hypothetical protein